MIGFPKGAGGKLAAYARETGVDAIGLDETVDPAWAARELPPDLPVQGNLDPLRCSPAARRLKARCERILSSVRGAAARLQPRPRHRQGHADRPCRAICSRWCASVTEAGLIDELGAALTLTYAWLKAGHIIFVIFWMAGLFMLPRFFVYHQEARAGLATRRRSGSSASASCARSSSPRR